MPETGPMCERCGTLRDVSSITLYGHIPVLLCIRCYRIWLKHVRSEEERKTATLVERAALGVNDPSPDMTLDGLLKLYECLDVSIPRLVEFVEGWLKEGEA